MMKPFDRNQPVSNESEVPLNMNIEQAARYLNTTPRQLRDLVRARIIPHFRIGRLIRFNRNKLAEWVESRIEEPLF
jgi:excisionase family DNA binding protein